MSEPIAHFGICDDTLRLALVHPAVPERFRALFGARRDIVRLGTVTPLPTALRSVSSERDPMCHGRLVRQWLRT